MTDNKQTGHHTHPPVFRFTFRARLVLLALGLSSNILILTEIVPILPGSIVFVFAVVLYTLLTIAYWKCPHCRRYPGNAVMPDYCEKCGEAIFGADAQVPDRKPDQGKIHLRLRYLVSGRIVFGIIVLAYFVVLAPQQSQSPAIFWLGAVTLISIGAWLEWRWWRCPHCGGYLKRSIWPGRSCPKCKQSLPY